MPTGAQELSVCHSLLSNPTSESYARAIQPGQIAVYKKIHLIRNHLKIELVLDEIVRKLRGVELFSMQ